MIDKKKQENPAMLPLSITYDLCRLINLHCWWKWWEYKPQWFLIDGSLWSKTRNCPDADLYSLIELFTSHVPYTLVWYHLCLRLQQDSYHAVMARRTDSRF